MSLNVFYLIVNKGNQDVIGNEYFFLATVKLLFYSLSILLDSEAKCHA